MLGIFKYNQSLEPRRPRLKHLGLNLTVIKGVELVNNLVLSEKSKTIHIMLAGPSDTDTALF